METTILYKDFKAPYTKLKDQDNESYELITKEELQKAFSNFATVIVKLYEAPYTLHNIQPRVCSYTKDNKVSKTETEKIIWYENYKKFLVDRFKKDQLFKVKIKEDE